MSFSEISSTITKFEGTVSGSAISDFDGTVAFKAGCNENGGALTLSAHGSDYKTGSRELRQHRGAWIEVSRDQGATFEKLDVQGLSVASSKLPIMGDEEADVADIVALMSFSATSKILGLLYQGYNIRVTGFNNNSGLMSIALWLKPTPSGKRALSNAAQMCDLFALKAG